MRFERDSKKKSPNRNWNESNQIKSPLRESESLPEKRSSGRLTLPSPIAVEFGIVGIRENGEIRKRNGTEEGENAKRGTECESESERDRVECLILVLGVLCS